MYITQILTWEYSGLNHQVCHYVDQHVRGKQIGTTFQYPIDIQNPSKTWWFVGACNPSTRLDGVETSR